MMMKAKWTYGVACCCWRWWWWAEQLLVKRPDRPMSPAVVEDGKERRSLPACRCLWRLQRKPEAVSCWGDRCRLVAVKITINRRGSRNREHWGKRRSEDWSHRTMSTVAGRFFGGWRSLSPLLWLPIRDLFGWKEYFVRCDLWRLICELWVFSLEVKTEDNHVSPWLCKKNPIGIWQLDMRGEFCFSASFWQNRKIGHEIAILRDFVRFLRFHPISTRFYSFSIFSSDSTRNACFDS